ncbi:urea ABC transporter ATP-binding subunit UrtE [Alcanivorax profundi]|uniref:Urea ABC transporter ATP-binding subunit UrtE n=1 Tax=Alcanivorax profundi TaxID=2338368 RepID=A0A418XYI8_9GAMM|nr:urea ABC transporter ATP-binding subunit UrtE [Alcanivorax profundi]RJG18095.1 urea ABC transporter ATP-binding subunit UrtE [Alcanivorax profundi]
MLKLNNVNQYYGESHTLWDLDLGLTQGECLCVMGRNGVGKTTLLKTIMGLLPVKSGRIEFDGEDFARLAAEERARAGIGYVPQGREIFPLLTVEENLETGLQARTDRSKKIPDRIYELFPVLHEMRNRRGGDLSGGQQQQLAIGRALALDPKLLILDEPTEGIQPNIVDMIGRVIKTLNKEEGLTVLLVEQKLHFARATADRFAILDRGSKVAEGAMGELDDRLIKEFLTV